MPGLKDKMHLIGKRALITMGKLKVEVKILDYKNTYNRDRFQVTPVSGKGDAWVENLEVIKAK